MKQITLVLELDDNGDPFTQTDDFIAGDLLGEINCCSNFYKFVSIEIDEKESEN